MTKTRDQLIERTLQRLGVIGEGRPAYPSEVVKVNTGIGPLLDSLQQREIIWIGDPENVEDAVFEQLAVLLADATRGFFGIATLPASADGIPSTAQAIDELRQIGYGRYSGAVQQGEYM